MSVFLRYTFIAFAIIAALFGVPLLIAPGRLLGFFGWAPIDPLISRMLGAALLGLAWGALRAVQWRTSQQVHTLVQVNAVFCTLAALGLLRNMLGAGWPFMVWFVLGLFVVFALLFIYHWWRMGKT